MVFQDVYLEEQILLALILVGNRFPSLIFVIIDN